MAVQALAEVQGTPTKKLSIEPDRLGVLWIVQDVPLHTSASVTPVSELVW